jgi:excisionase family DNA binding protein
MTEFLTLEAAAAELGVSKDTIRAAIYDGRLKAKKTGKGGGGRISIRRTDLAAFWDAMEDA